MPFIDRDFINDLSNRVDIVSLINKRVALKKPARTIRHVAHSTKKRHLLLRLFRVNRYFIVLVVVRVAV